MVEGEVVMPEEAKEEVEVISHKLIFLMLYMNKNHPLSTRRPTFTLLNIRLIVVPSTADDTATMSQ